MYQPDDGLFREHTHSALLQSMGDSIVADKQRNASTCKDRAEQVGFQIQADMHEQDHTASCIPGEVSIAHVGLGVQQQLADVGHCSISVGTAFVGWVAGRTGSSGVQSLSLPARLTSSLLVKDPVAHCCSCQQSKAI
jgi:hypothetical protein